MEENIPLHSIDDTLQDRTNGASETSLDFNWIQVWIEHFSAAYVGAIDRLSCQQLTWAPVSAKFQIVAFQTVVYNFTESQHSGPVSKFKILLLKASRFER